MTRPRIGVIAHRRQIESPLGTYPAAVVAEPYLRHLSELGADPLIVWPGIRTDVTALMDGMLLIGGGDVDPSAFGSPDDADDVDPDRDATERETVRACHARRIPLLGMCRGAQILNVALSGTLQRVQGHRQTGPLSQPSHRVDIAPGSNLASLFGEPALEVNSYHQWAVDLPGDGLEIVAYSQDGTPEAVETTEPDWWCMGIQWHAELLTVDHGARPFAGLVEAARR